jgi:1,4-alpha-glucan branching enzyme
MHRGLVDPNPPMKHHKTHKGPHLIPVHFEFTHPTATTVCVAGCFNHWQPEAKALHPSGGGRWVKETVLAPGTYEYCLVVDGEWMPDPMAKDYVPNPFGGKNSILTVKDSQEASQPPVPETLPLKSATKQKTKIV